VVCKSREGEVYEIEGKELIRRIRMNEESYRVLLMMSISKEKAIEQKIERIRNMR
jgi:hypothetical protein